MFVLKRIDHTCFQPTNGTANRTANEGQTQVPILYTTLKKHPSLDQDFVRQLDFKSMVATSTL